MEEDLNYIRKGVDESSLVHNYNPDDVRRAKSQNWWIQDFLIRENNDAEAAALLFVKCLKWREKFGVQGIGALELSNALAENFIYFHGCDLERRNILWLNWSRYQFITTRRTAERLLVYWLERHAMETQNAQFTFTVNFHGSDMRDVDLNFVQFLFLCINDYYPRCVHRILLYDIPQSMWTKWQEFSTFAQKPHCIIKMVNVDRSSIDIYIPFKFLPRNMGGEDEYVFVMHRLSHCIYSRQIDKSNENLENEKIFNDDFSRKLSDENSVAKKMVTFKTEPDNNNSDDVITSVSGNEIPCKDFTVPSTRVVQSSALKLDANDAFKNSLSASDNDMETADMFLGISENDLLVLKKTSNQGEYTVQLTLENRSRNGCQIFKVKTTAPQKFRVRPTLGMISAGERQTISIMLDRAYEKTYRMERFLISTILMNDSIRPTAAEALQDFASFFANAKSEETFQIKLNCVMEKENGENSANSNEANQEAKEINTEKADSMDRELALFLAERELTILKQVNGIRQQLNANRIIIVVVILIQAVMFLYFMKTDIDRFV